MNRMMKRFSFLAVLVALFTVLTVTAYADDPAPSVDMSLAFAPETQLVVYVDGEWDSAQSDIYGFGDNVKLSAPPKEGKTFSHWEADGSVISYANPLNLTVNAHTTLYAVYADTAPTTEPVAGFTSISRTNDGNSIVFQAIADPGDGGTIASAGIVYSTTATDDNLKIDGTDVTTVAAERLTESTTEIPQSVLDDNNCWMLEITPESGDTVHARAYVTIGEDTTYGDVKDVKLSDLASGISLIANLEGFEPGINDELSELTEGMKTVIFDANGGVGATVVQAYLGDTVTLRLNTFTREGYNFSGWSTEQNGGGTTYTDGQTVTLNEDTTLYAQWRTSGGGGGGTPTYKVDAPASVDNGTVTVSPKSAAKGQTVTVTPKPDQGYETSGITVTDTKGNNIPVTKNADGTYTFTMPASAVTVTPTFTKSQESPADGACPKDATCPISKFTDAKPDAWYHDGIHYCLENGLMNGVGNNQFDPSGTTSRGMIVTILYRMEREPEVTAENPFDDVEADRWYTDAVIWAAANKIVEGYGNEKFGPNDDITREQLATILYRYAQFKGLDVSVGEDTNILDFEDAGTWSSWSVDALQWAVGSGIVGGKDGNRLDPKGDASRAEAATMLQRFCENVAE